MGFLEHYNAAQQLMSIIIKLQFLIAHNLYQKWIRFLRFVYLCLSEANIDTINTIYRTNEDKKNLVRFEYISGYDKTSLRELKCNIILYQSFDSSTKLTYF